MNRVPARHPAAPKSRVSFGWAVEIVGAFQDEGERIPLGAIQLLPFVEVVLWARARRSPASVAAIIKRWGVSRATAYRWHRDLYGSSAPRGGDMVAVAAEESGS